MSLVEPDTVILAARRITHTELSLRPRVAHGALCAAALTGTVVVASLWLTEPDLPVHTRLAFGALSLTGLIWAGYAIWVLRQRRVLYARQRVLAGWLAVTFTSVFAVAAFATGFLTNAPAGFVAGTMGLALVGVASRLLIRARRRLDTLLARRAELEA